MRTVLRPGETCWRIEQADAVAVIIDAADYLRVVRDAMQHARHSILLIGWDFDTRIELDPADDDGDVPNKLGRFLKWLVKNRPELHVHLLKWNLGALQSLGRGDTPLVVLRWVMSSRVHFRLDHAHPAAAAHHQKIVVIDDALAFCGGIDMTADRWDTRAHTDDDPRRRRPTTRRRYGPWHDATAAVTGDAARALGDLARGRWERATREKLEPPPRVEPHWPEGLEPLAEHVPVAISRTMPEYDGRKAVHEIEALYLAVIEATERTLYIESQYFASRKVAEAMAARLAEPDGPEFVVVNPESADGWLEEEVMGSSRARLLRLIERADVHDRFRLYTPVTEGGEDIYVHAKVLVMDDRLLRVGSSNLNNRSMGFDTECDLSMEAGADEKELRTRILHLRHDLMAEHLGVAIEAVEDAVHAADGSLIQAIETLRSEGRSLVPFEPPELNELEEEVLAENELLDPERPSRRSRALRLSRWLPWVRSA
ncbi:MAG: phospholipase [Rhodobacteraceae bacterium]|nr:phospholipase [Paracoccaceae bacterium]